MGIPPYFCPEELAEIECEIKHYEEFLKINGYENIKNIKNQNNFISPEGIEYKTAKEFYKGHGYYPCLEKNGICHGYYEIQKLKNYVRLYDYDKEIKFLETKGYKRAKNLDDDYIENNNKLKEYYEKFGFCPRWEKGSKLFGHRQALILENYV